MNEELKTNAIVLAFGAATALPALHLLSGAGGSVGLAVAETIGIAALYSYPILVGKKALATCGFLAVTTFTGMNLAFNSVAQNTAPVATYDGQQLGPYTGAPGTYPPAIAPMPGSDPQQAPPQSQPAPQPQPQPARTLQYDPGQ